MRHVELRAEDVKEVIEQSTIVRRKTEHLNARMSELVVDGLTVSFGVELQGVGWVRIRFPGLESDEAAEILRLRYQIESCPVGPDGMVHFRVTEKASFEDMDYVQAAVMDLLYGS